MKDRLSRLRSVSLRINTESLIAWSDWDIAQGRWGIDAASAFVISFINALPKSCIALEIENFTCLDDYRLDAHVCDALAAILPRLHHLRLYGVVICPSLFEDEPEQHPRRFGNLETLCIAFGPSMPMFYSEEPPTEQFCGSNLHSHLFELPGHESSPPALIYAMQNAMATHLRDCYDRGSFFHIRSLSLFLVADRVLVDYDPRITHYSHVDVVASVIHKYPAVWFINELPLVDYTNPVYLMLSRAQGICTNESQTEFFFADHEAIVPILGLNRKITKTGVRYPASTSPLSLFDTEVLKPIDLRSTLVSRLDLVEKMRCELDNSQDAWTEYGWRWSNDEDLLQRASGATASCESGVVETLP